MTPDSLASFDLPIPAKVRIRAGPYSVRITKHFEVRKSLDGDYLCCDVVQPGGYVLLPPSSGYKTLLPWRWRVQVPPKHQYTYLSTQRQSAKGRSHPGHTDTAGQKTPRREWKAKCALECLHQPVTVPYPSQMNALHILTFCFFRDMNYHLTGQNVTLCRWLQFHINVFCLLYVCAVSVIGHLAVDSTH